MKMGLGTVQFGLNYGLTNTQGQTSLNEVDRILTEAEHQGIRILDTAHAYGNSEEVLGNVLRKDHPFKIVTKTKPLGLSNLKTSDINSVETSFLSSLKKLNQNACYGLLVHHVQNLLHPLGESLFNRMLQLQKEGLVQKIGASVYTREEIDELLDRFNVDLIQLPLNIFDQRLIQSGSLKKLNAAGVEIHVRSVFLQGLILQPPSRLSSWFDPMKPFLSEYHHHLDSRGITALQSALSFVEALEEIDHYLIGVNDLSQLKQNLTDLQKANTQLDWSNLAWQGSEQFLNPSQWQ